MGAEESDNPYAAVDSTEPEDPDNPFAEELAKSQIEVQEPVKPPEPESKEHDFEYFIRKMISASGNEKVLKELKVLIRVTIELFVTLEDFKFLFYELFKPFQETDKASIFFDELKPFILAGRLSD